LSGEISPFRREIVHKANVTPEEFIAKWRGSTRTERSAAQEHFLDLY
jgi:hypothetical protein